MDAKEYLFKKQNIEGDPSDFHITITFKDVYELMESYYQTKSKEISEDDIRRVWYFHANVGKDGEYLTEEGFKTAIKELTKPEK